MQVATADGQMAWSLGGNKPVSSIQYNIEIRVKFRGTLAAMEIVRKSTGRRAALRRSEKGRVRLIIREFYATPQMADRRLASPSPSPYPQRRNAKTRRKRRIVGWRRKRRIIPRR